MWKKAWGVNTFWRHCTFNKCSLGCKRLNIVMGDTNHLHSSLVSDSPLYPPYLLFRENWTRWRWPHLSELWTWTGTSSPPLKGQRSITTYWLVGSSLSLKSHGCLHDRSHYLTSILYCPINNVLSLVNIHTRKHQKSNVHSLFYLRSALNVPRVLLPEQDDCSAPAPETSQQRPVHQIYHHHQGKQIHLQTEIKVIMYQTSTRDFGFVLRAGLVVVL